MTPPLSSTYVRDMDKPPRGVGRARSQPRAAFGARTCDEQRRSWPSVISRANKNKITYVQRVCEVVCICRAPLRQWGAWKGLCRQGSPPRVLVGHSDAREAPSVVITELESGIVPADSEHHKEVL